MKTIADRITIDDRICNGKPIIRGTRLTVNTILQFLSAGESREELLYQYPDLENEDIDACLKFASDLMKRNFIIRTFASSSKSYEFLQNEEELYQMSDVTEKYK